MYEGSRTVRRAVGGKIRQRIEVGIADSPFESNDFLDFGDSPERVGR